MTARPQLNRDEAQLLLPFAANGTLTPDEAAGLAEWLARDADLRQELERHRHRTGGANGIFFFEVRALTRKQEERDADRAKRAAELAAMPREKRRRWSPACRATIAHSSSQATAGRAAIRRDSRRCRA